jgi:hypothetical protein
VIALAVGHAETVGVVFVVPPPPEFDPPPPHPAMTRVAATTHQADRKRITSFSLGSFGKRIVASNSKPGCLSIVCTWDRFLVRALNRQSALEGPVEGAYIKARIGSDFLQPTHAKSI